MASPAPPSLVCNLRISPNPAPAPMGASTIDRDPDRLTRPKDSRGGNYSVKMAHGIKSAAILKALQTQGPFAALTTGLVGSFGGDQAIIQSGILAPPPSRLAGKVAGIPIVFLLIGGGGLLLFLALRK